MKLSAEPGQLVLLSTSQIAEITSLVHLSEERRMRLERLPLTVTRIAVNSDGALDAMGKRLAALNTYGEEETVDSVDPSELSSYYQQLLSSTFLQADGLILSLGGRDLAYACFYPVWSEHDPTTGEVRQDLLPYFQECHVRSNWSGIAQYLGRVLDDKAPIDLRRLVHVYDYATPSLSDRGKGYGRFILRLASDALLHPDAIRIGFIDPEHGDSLLASCQAGSILGLELPVSPDGPHSSFISFFGTNIQTVFTEDQSAVVMSAEEAKRNLPEFIAALRAAVGDRETVVAFNSHRQNYERAVITYGDSSSAISC